MPDNDKTPQIERRAFTVELRAADDKRMITGHAAVFDTTTSIGGWFKERVARGAFAETIKNDDIRALFNHDPNIVLGRNRAGTLRLWEDDKGLAFEIDLPDTTAANDLYISIKRGDVSQCSFGFSVKKAEWDFTEDDLDGRTLKEVKLWDISPVTYAAYPTTDANVRSAEQVWSQRAAERDEIEHPKPEEHRQEPDVAEQGFRDRLRMGIELLKRLF